MEAWSSRLGDCPVVKVVEDQEVESPVGYS